MSKPYYECSSKGDRRFSALYARLEDGRSIEEHYQCDVKGHDPGGTNWRLGKGKPPLDRGVDTLGKYRGLWFRYLMLNPQLVDELAVILKTHTLRDQFARGAINQADALTWIMAQ